MLSLYKSNKAKWEMRRALYSPSTGKYCIFSIKWINTSQDNTFMFIQNHPWNYSLDFKICFGIGKVLRKRKQKKKKKLKGWGGFHVSPVKTWDCRETSPHRICHPPTQINILGYLHPGTYYFRDPPYLESPSHKAGSQRTSCERNKAIYLVSISAFPKESSFQLSEVFK